MKVYFEFAACASMKLRIKNIKGRKPSPRTKLNFLWNHKSILIVDRNADRKRIIFSV